MEQDRQTNNLGVDIPKLLAEKYPNWMRDCPEILQLNEDLEPIREWKNKKEITLYTNKKVQGLDLALRKSCRFQGYFWIAKVLYENEGIRPVKTIKRNDPIYAYNPCDEMLQRYYNYEDLDIKDFFKPGIAETFQFIGRFSNSVAVSKTLDLSITNIRRVAKCDPDIIFHKDYWFSFVPLLKIHQLEADIIKLSHLNERGVLREDDKINLINYIKEFKELYTEEGRVVGFIEKELWSLIKNMDLKSLSFNNKD